MDEKLLPIRTKPVLRGEKPGIRLSNEAGEIDGQKALQRARSVGSGEAAVMVMRG